MSVAFNMSGEFNKAEDFKMPEEVEMSEESQLRRYVCGVTMERERLEIPPRNLSYIYDGSHRTSCNTPQDTDLEATVVSMIPNFPHFKISTKLMKSARRAIENFDLMQPVLIHGPFIRQVIKELDLSGHINIRRLENSDIFQATLLTKSSAAAQNAHNLCLSVLREYFESLTHPQHDRIKTIKIHEEDNAIYQRLLWTLRAWASNWDPKVKELDFDMDRSDTIMEEFVPKSKLAKAVWNQFVDAWGSTRPILVWWHTRLTRDWHTRRQAVLHEIVDQRKKDRIGKWTQGQVEVWNQGGQWDTEQTFMGERGPIHRPGVCILKIRVPVLKIRLRGWKR